MQFYIFKKTAFCFIDRKELEDVRDEIFTFRKKGIFNWRLLKKYLKPEVIIDYFISAKFVQTDLWDWIKDKPRSSQMESILSNALKHIETSDDYDKFEAIVTEHNPFIELQTPSDDLIIQIDSKIEHLCYFSQLLKSYFFSKLQTKR